MNDSPLQPGDKTPSDAQRPGDEAKLQPAGANAREGDKAPNDSAAPDDQKKLEKQKKEGGSPLSGVNFSEPFIKRPVATFLLSIAIIIAGCVAYKLLPVASSTLR